VKDLEAMSPIQGEAQSDRDQEGSKKGSCI